MTPAEISIWSAAVGVYGLSTLLGLVYAVVTQSRTGWHTMAFLGTTGIFVASTSGLIRALSPTSFAYGLNMLDLLSGPISGGIGSWLLAYFLRAKRRDALVQRGLTSTGALCMALCACVFLNDHTLALNIVAVGVVASALFSCGLTIRAALLGDRSAWYMAAGTAVGAVMVFGLYSQAQDRLRGQLVWQAAVAVSTVLYLVICTRTVWQRNVQQVRMTRALARDQRKDLLTQLITGHALVNEVNASIRRAHRSRKEMAIVCVELFNASPLRKQHGLHALEEVVYTMAARVRQAAGAVTHVGRYSDTSFVVVLDSLKQMNQLRSIGLRLASAARKPYMLHPYSSEPSEFRCDIGVGIARIRPGRERARIQETGFASDSISLAQEALHDAAQLASASRTMRSRCAIIDGTTRQQVAVEDADLSS